MKQQLDNPVTSVTSQTQGKQMQHCPFEPQEIGKKWHVHEISSIHAIAALHWKLSAQEPWETYVPDFHDWLTIQKGWGKHVVLQKLPSSQHIFFDSWIVTFFYWCPISKLQKMDVNVSPDMDFHPTMVFQHLFSDKTPKFGRVHCYLPAAMNGC